MSLNANLQFVNIKTEENGRFLPFHISSAAFRLAQNCCNVYIQAIQSYFRNIVSQFDLDTEELNSTYNQIRSTETESSKNSFYFVKQNGSTLVKFNACSHEVTEKALRLRHNDLTVPIICQVSSSFLFLHGGRNFDMQFFGSTYLLNTDSMSYIRISEGVTRGGCSGLLHDLKIYIFGGYLRQMYRGVKLRTSNYFDLKIGIWRPLSDLPEPQYGTSTCLIENSILITGRKHNFLQLYLIGQDSYLNLNTKVEFGMVNLLLRYKEHVFLITSSNIYRALVSDLGKWNIVGKSVQGLANSLNYDVACFGKYAYFSDCYGYIFQFDFEGASVKIVTKVV